MVCLSAIDSDLGVIQNFLDGHHKRKLYTSERIDVRDLLEKAIGSSSSYVQLIPVALLVTFF